MAGGEKKVYAGWKDLAKEISERINPIADRPPVILYFAITVVVIGTFGVWFPAVFPYLMGDPPGFDLLSLARNLSTYIVALLGAMMIDFFLGDSESSNGIRTLAIGVGTLSAMFALIGLITVHDGYALPSAVSGMFLCWFAWFLIPGAGFKLLDEAPPPTASTGGPSNSTELSGNLADVEH